MTRKATKHQSKPRPLLIDSGVVFRAYRYSVWDKLILRVEVIVPSTVCRVEAQGYETLDGQWVAIDLPGLRDEGKIVELEATQDELALPSQILAPSTLEELDAGEMEALCLMLSRQDLACSFCSGDGAAIRAIAMLGLSERAISMETVLKSVGLTKRLPRAFTEEFFQKHLRKGQECLITRLGLVPR